jgi:hypothetical protein
VYTPRTVVPRRGSDFRSTQKLTPVHAALVADCNLRETLVGLEDGDGQRLLPLGLRQLVIEAYETTNAQTQRELLRMARSRRARGLQTARDAGWLGGR